MKFLIAINILCFTYDMRPIIYLSANGLYTKTHIKDKMQNIFDLNYIKNI